MTRERASSTIDTSSPRKAAAHCSPQDTHYPFRATLAQSSRTVLQMKIFGHFGKIHDACDRQGRKEKEKKTSAEGLAGEKVRFTFDH
ncbi:hypothetical protein CDAR_274301 [Caerostris darwini]|uniref:Uncharacterized protein n=1 Tax=Caerostris darwini TaxID=1538125 RepID=A0AAV4RCQ7_9ARAC|nr:hypothetical protein CDAR_274301 [Caerostris darwini]